MLVTVKYLAFECRALAKICSRNGGEGREKGWIQKQLVRGNWLHTSVIHGML